MIIKIIRGEGGLGSQMLQTALYLVLKENDSEVFFELSDFDRYKQHNGWEIQKIFKNVDIKILEHNHKLNKNRESFFERKKKKLIKIFNKALYIKLYKKSYFENWISEESRNRQIKFFKLNFDKNIKLDKVFMCCGANFTEESLNYLKIGYYIGPYLSENYFLNIEDKVRKTFEFPKITEKENIELLERIEGKETVAIHIRRGDYVDNTVLGGLAPLSYYKKAIEYINEKIKNPIFIIFSNDIEWCKENLDFENNNVEYINWNKREKSFRDMQLMSLCKHNIIPNSTFSWWGAWLNKNPNKIVIAPKKWFTDESGISSDNVNSKSWIEIKNY